VIDLMHDQRDVTDKGGTMRLAVDRANGRNPKILDLGDPGLVHP
jgi:hypothetical protein